MYKMVRNQSVKGFLRMNRKGQISFVRELFSTKDPMDRLQRSVDAFSLQETKRKEQDRSRRDEGQSSSRGPRLIAEHNG